MTSLIPQKKFSQNFLVNIGMQEKIFKTFQTFLGDTKSPLIEIGPGRGDMTQNLIKLNLPLTCLELDPQAIEYLNHKNYILDNPNIELRLVDALEQLEISNNPTLPKNFNLFSSLPYSTGSRMLVAMGINYPESSFGVIVQKEVAQKTKIEENKITLFGIWLNLIWDTKLTFNIAPGNFYPAPSVMSSFLTGRSKTRLPDFLDNSTKRQNVLNLLHKLVAQPKKTLANNLKAILPNRELVYDFLDSLEIDHKERLSYENYYPVIEQLTKKGY